MDLLPACKKSLNAISTVAQPSNNTPPANSAVIQNPFFSLSCFFPLPISNPTNPQKPFLPQLDDLPAKEKFQHLGKKNKKTHKRNNQILIISVLSANKNCYYSVKICDQSQHEKPEGSNERRTHARTPALSSQVSANMGFIAHVGGGRGFESHSLLAVECVLKPSSVRFFDFADNLRFWVFSKKSNNLQFRVSRFLKNKSVFYHLFLAHP